MNQRSGGRVFRALLLGLILFACGPGAHSQLTADWVLYNGKILTANTEDPANFTVAQALATYDGKFVVVGTDQEALRVCGSQHSQD